MKKLLVLLLVLLLSGFAFAGGAQEGEDEGTGSETETVAPATIEGVSPNQSPMLQTMVAAGELPPLEERIPADPYVIPLTSEGWGPGEIGQYGGTWNRAAIATSGAPLAYTIGIISSKSDINWPSPKSNIGTPTGQFWTEWGFSDDLLSFTAKIRQGVRWSDGVELTADDYVFGFADVTTNPDIGEVGGVWATGGETVTIEKLGTYEIRFNFASPYPAFETVLIRQGETLARPMHYLREYHPRYSDQYANAEEPYAVFNEMAASGGVDEGGLVNPDLPVLWAWKIAEINFPEYAIFERNPYFSMVDPAGNQLPYIDYIRVDLESDPEVIFLKALSGAYDYQRDQIRAEEGKDVLLVQNREKGNYHFISEKPNTRMMRMLFINWDTPNEKLRELFHTREFRLALSYGTNRDDINQIMYNGRAIPKNHYYANLSPYYEEGYEQRYTEYEPETAASMLDELNVVDQDGDGWRDYPDGSELILIIDATEEVARRAHAEMVVEDWKDIGLNAQVKVLTGAAFGEKIRAGQHDIVCDWPGAGTFFPETEASTWGPVRGGRSNHGTPQLTIWYETNGERGLAPEEGSPYAEIYELIQAAAVEPDRDARVEMYREIGRIHAEQVLHIGLTSVPAPQGTEVLVSNDLSNAIQGHIHDQSDRRGEVYFFNTPERRNAPSPLSN